MLPVLPEMYSPVLVLVSVLLACTASFSALSLTARLSSLHGRVWFLWWALGTLVLGLGIWSMHFVGMLALHVGMPMTYRFWPTLLSVLPAALASGIVLQVASRPQLTAGALVTSSLVMGAGIAGMHYLGMHAVGQPLHLTFDAGRVVLSVLIAVLASGAALYLAFSLRPPSAKQVSPVAARRGPAPAVQRLLASGLLGLGIASMHYTGMWATTFTAHTMDMPIPAGAHQNALAVTISVAVFALLGLLAASLVAERHFSRQQRQRDELEALVQLRTAELGQALESKEQMYRTSLAAAERSHHTLNALREGVTQLDADGTVLICNVSAATLLDLHPDDILGRRLENIPLQLDDEHGQKTDQNVLLQRLLDHPGVAQTIGRRRANGSYQWLSAVRHDFRQAPAQLGDPVQSEQMVVCMTDITEQRENERQLYRQANTDALTGLANRHALYECLPELLYNATWTRTSVAVLFVDLDQFKAINDSVGHSVGDEVLIQVSRRLEAMIRQPNLLVRLGGDEFCVVIDAVSHVDEVTDLAAQLHRQLLEPFSFDGHHFRVGASIGISVFPELADSAQSLLRQADLAMYRVKRNGRGGATVFRPEIEQAVLRQAEVEQHLQQAIAGREFELVYQPLVRLKDGRVTGCEALLRWTSADLGPVSPAEFIPIAEQSGLIYQLDEWVIREACSQAASWSAQGRDLEVNVNVSALHVQRPELVDHVQRVLDETGLPPRQLRLELTEGALMLDMESALRQLHALRALGVQLALDDFGTGYSSLSWLQSLPIEQLKLDRSLLDRATEEPRRALILTSFIALAQTLGITVVSEGVETAAQLALLEQLGCDFGQGYFLSRPVSPAALLDLPGRIVGQTSSSMEQDQWRGVVTP